MSTEPSPTSAETGATVASPEPADTFTRERWAWLRQVAMDDELTPFAFRVAFVLADHLNRETRLSWPSQDRVGQMLKATRKGIQGALVQLAERGHLAIIPSTNRKGGNRYRPIALQPGEGLDHATRGTHEDAAHATDGLHESTSHANGRTHDASFHDTGGWHEVGSHATRGTHEDAAHATDRSTVMPPAGGPNLLNEPVEIEKDSIPAQSKPKRRPPTPKAKTSDTDFEEWWLQVPKAVGKADARRAYDRALLSGAVTHAEMLAGMLRYAAERVGQDQQYTKHPATWINKGCWSDAPAQARPAVRDQPMTRAQASRSEARDALDAIASGMDPEDVKRGLHLRRNPKSSRMEIANRFAEELERRSGKRPNGSGGPIIIDNDDQGGML